MDLKDRADIAPFYLWDLESFYPDIEQWEREFSAAEAEIPERIQSFSGRLAEGPATLLELIELHLSSLRRLERLYTYAHLRSDEDTTQAKSLALLDRATNLYSRYATASSYIVPELLALPEESSLAYLSATELQPYRRMLEEILRYRPHTLSDREESLLAQSSEIFGSIERIFSQLNNADLSFGTVTVDGEDRALTHGSFILFLKNPSREVRKRAYDKFYEVFDSHKNTIAATLGSSLKVDVFQANIRGYESSLARALFPDHMPAEVYQNLINTVAAALPSLHEYYKLRGELLGIADQRLFDTHVPLVEEIRTKIPYEEAIEIALEALEPLGKDYCSTLERGLRSERWADVFESRGKRSGAYSSGCYDSHPYMLLNYKEDLLSDLFTFVHEIGHSMHSALSRSKQPYQDYQYGIFVAEVASTFNEQLLLAHLRKRYAGDRKMLRYLLNHQLDEIKGTFFRQTMFAEFELKTHALVEENRPLTTEELKIIYLELLKKYFGPAISIEEKDWLECLRIPHFYHAFYVYKYATGISAAITLSERVLNQQPGAVESYLGFLKAGGSKPPLEVLQDAGVDMRKPDSVLETTRVFERRLEELRAII
jgi:oligoendopeptidase F